MSVNPRLINGGCTSGDDKHKDNNEDEDEDDEDDDRSYDVVNDDSCHSFRPKATQNITKKASCSSILRQNR